LHKKSTFRRGLAELQKVSGAQVWVSDTSAATLAAGGVDPGKTWSLDNLFDWAGVQKFDAPRVDHRFKDGEKIQLGTIELTPVHTPGQGGSCTTLSFSVSDGERLLRVVDVCNLKLGDPLAPMLPIIKRLEPRTYARIRSDFEQSFKILKSIPVDIWVTAHARDFGRYRKFVASASAKNPVDPFIDRAGYLDYLDKAEKRFRELFAEPQRQ
jgi:metallo-beta-lactamase class B